MSRVGTQRPQALQRVLLPGTDESAPLSARYNSRTPCYAVRERDAGSLPEEAYSPAWSCGTQYRSSRIAAVQHFCPLNDNPGGISRRRDRQLLLRSQGQMLYTGWVRCLPALSTNMMTLRNGDSSWVPCWAAAALEGLAGPENHAPANSSNWSTRQGRLDSFVLASLQRQPSELWPMRRRSGSSR